jgi:hypothetical protein
MWRYREGRLNASGPGVRGARTVQRSLLAVVVGTKSTMRMPTVWPCTPLFIRHAGLGWREGAQVFVGAKAFHAKDIRLVQTMQVGPCIPVGTQL